MMLTQAFITLAMGFSLPNESFYFYLPYGPDLQVMTYSSPTEKRYVTVRQKLMFSVRLIDGPYQSSPWRFRVVYACRGMSAVQEVSRTPAALQAAYTAAVEACENGV